MAIEIAKAIITLGFSLLSTIAVVLIVIGIWLQAMKRVERNWHAGTTKAMEVLSSWAAKRHLELLEAVPTNDVWTDGVAWNQRRFSVTMRDAKGKKRQGVAICGHRTFGYLFDTVEVEWPDRTKPEPDVDFG